MQLYDKYDRKPPTFPRKTKPLVYNSAWKETENRVSYLSRIAMMEKLLKKALELRFRDEDQLAHAPNPMDRSSMKHCGLSVYAQGHRRTL